MGLREAKKLEQRRAILDTAVALFKERGFAETRVQEITDRLSISEQTFFNYFPTKQSVLEAAAADTLERTMSLLHRDLDDASRLVTDQLEELVRSFAQSFEGDREFARLLALNVQLWLLPRQQRQTYELLTRLLASGQRRGEIRADVPDGQLAEVFISVMLGTISNWLLPLDGEAPADEAAAADPLNERLLRAWHVLRAGAESRGPGPSSGAGKQRRTRSPGAARRRPT